MSVFSDVIVVLLWHVYDDDLSQEVCVLIHVPLTCIVARTIMLGLVTEEL